MVELLALDRRLQVSTVPIEASRAEALAKRQPLMPAIDGFTARVFFEADRVVLSERTVDRKPTKNAVLLPACRGWTSSIRTASSLRRFPRPRCRRRRRLLPSPPRRRVPLRRRSLPRSTRRRGNQRLENEKMAQVTAEVKRKADASARATSAPTSSPGAPGAPASGAADAVPASVVPGAPFATPAGSTGLVALVGVYAAGTVDFTVALRADGVLTSSAPGQPVVELEPAGGLRFTFKGAPGFSAEFRQDPSGAVNDVLVHQPNGSAVAVRVSGERVDPKVMATLAGEYEIGSAVLTVRVEGAGLTYLVPGQPLHHLVYAHGLRFSVRGVAGVSIEFQRGTGGEVTGLVSRQANGDVQARRR